MSNTGRSAPAPTGIPAHPMLTATGRDTPPPWLPPPTSPARCARPVCRCWPVEGVTEHIHAHLDILVAGNPVPVPAFIGIDHKASSISPVHVHDTTGVIHIESPVQADFSLGQLFTEWQVTLSATQLGGLHTSDATTLRAYVNGAPVAGDPAAAILHAHDEIALVHGPADARQQVPTSYAFPHGE